MPNDPSGTAVSGATPGLSLPWRVETDINIPGQRWFRIMDDTDNLVWVDEDEVLLRTVVRQVNAHDFLVSALQRMTDMAQKALGGKTIRDAAETFGEAAHALKKADAR